ncbi:MAG: hypothetical protein LBJ46_07880 [Planctomycetota bacterium]|jgi:heptosyltransferase-2|nr:hypothetical protein [Planctomycetota bacterium]
MADFLKPEYSAPADRIAVLRPGALGDVLCARGLLAAARAAEPTIALSFAAPGERGRLFADAGWIDRALDWDASAWSWLYRADDAEPPAALREFFARCRAVFAFLGDGARVAARLAAAAPNADIHMLPSRPPGDDDGSIYLWMARQCGDWLVEKGWRRPEVPRDPDAFARLRFARCGVFPDERPGRYVVAHPGSGSVRKNWPVAHFAAVCRALAASETGIGRFVVVSGEADGDLGDRLHRLLPGSLPIARPALPELAALLAGADLYLGNDGGVGHLAAAVETEDGSRPRVAVVFGPTDSRVWRPPGALALEAGKGMDGLDPLAAAERIRAFFGSARGRH